MHCVKVAVHYFKKQGTGGKIVMTASTAGYMSEPGVPVYSASKHGVVGYMRAMKKELQRQNIAINCVAPWMTDTPLIYPQLREILAANNIPVQPPSAVAIAMAFSATAPEWSGKTVYAAMSQYTELEEPILKLEEQWLGIENSKLFRIGQELDYLTATSESMPSASTRALKLTSFRLCFWQSGCQLMILIMKLNNSLATRYYLLRPSVKHLVFLATQLCLLGSVISWTTSNVHGFESPPLHAWPQAVGLSMCGLFIYSDITDSLHNHETIIFDPYAMNLMLPCAAPCMYNNTHTITNMHSSP